MAYTASHEVKTTFETEGPTRAEVEAISARPDNGLRPGALSRRHRGVTRPAFSPGFLYRLIPPSFCAGLCGGFRHGCDDPTSGAKRCGSLMPSNA
jgi:hypothetical protein